jgi:hypothetical protein
VLRIAALALAAAATAQTPALKSNVQWWEKVTLILTGDGKPQSCKYESSIPAAPSNDCEVRGSPASLSSSSGLSKAEYTRITFERQFIPGQTQPAEGGLEVGDTLLGRQVMQLAIDPAGMVKGCRVVAKSGDVTPDYGCDEARTERFEANAAKASESHGGFMTIRVYGHAEHVA